MGEGSGGGVRYPTASDESSDEDSVAGVSVIEPGPFQAVMYPPGSEGIFVTLIGRYSGVMPWVRHQHRKFRFSTNCERISLLVGVLFAVVAGVGVPAINLIYGEFTKILIDRQYPSDQASEETFILDIFGGGRVLMNASREERMQALDEDALAFALGVIVFSVLAFTLLGLSVFIFNFTSLRQVNRIRYTLLRTLLTQTPAWFDVRDNINFTSKISDVILLLIRLDKITVSTALLFSFGDSATVLELGTIRNIAAEDLKNVQNGIGERLSIFIYQMSITVIILGTSLNVGWQLTLVLLGCLIPMLIVFLFLNQIQSAITANEVASIENSTQTAEEVFSGIRTVAAFGGEEQEIQRFTKKLLVSQTLGITKGIASGLGVGFVWIIIYSCYAVAFSFGFRLIIWLDEYTPAVLITVFFAVLTAATSLSYSGPYWESFAIARSSAATVFEIIGTKSEINPLSDDGISQIDCKGLIEFRNVHFHYPSRPGVEILKGLNFKINPGEKVAIVGGSGSGKSTVFQLIQRLYDPVEGDIYLDGTNLKSLNVSWLRRQISVVFQEPVLFTTTIANNISFGLSYAREAEVIDAAKKANAHEFITKLTNEYRTEVGGREGNLSGGEKQRIAIARALIRNCKILLLDEATSALDQENEKLIRTAITEAAIGRTTLMITHKISSLAGMDRIIVLDGGVVAEEGTHEQLLNCKGIYSRLLKAEAEVLDRIPTRAPNAGRMTDLSRGQVEEGIKLLPGARGNYFSDFGTGSADEMRRKKVLDDRYIRVNCWQFLKWNKSHWGFFYFGMLASVLLGCILPIVCVLYGELVGLLSVTEEETINKIDNFSLILVLVGLSSGVLSFIQMYFLGVASVRLTTYLKLKTFAAIINQEMAWFDSNRNSVSTLCARLNNDSSTVQGVIGGRVGVMVQGFTTMLVGFFISLYYSWKMALVSVLAVPIIFTGIFLDLISSSKLRKKEAEAEENSTKIAFEAVKNIKLISSLGKESFFLSEYVALLRTHKTCGHFWRSVVRGFAYSIGQTTMLFGYALSLWFGAYLMHKENLHYKDVMRVSELVIYGCWVLGQAISLAPNFKSAKEAAGRLQYLFLRAPRIRSGPSVLPAVVSGNDMIEFNNVYFSYPTRPDTIVLKNINLSIKEGESVALVGGSGSGKSTILQMLLRFYDPNVGYVSLRKRKLTALTLSALRRSIGVVSQEPVLFDRTVYENIAYGDNERIIDLEDVIAAAKAANIHSFISSLPGGYYTKLGSTSSSHFSRGQKQKIAIARALIRNPKILLLDEATSALDPESEKSIQEVLDNAMSGRTTITVAHRWGAIANSDSIYVMVGGRIVESGTHSNLMKQKGVYYKMREETN